MTAFELDTLLRQEADAFSGQCAYLVADAREPAPLHARLENEVFPAASTIKTPILLAALEQVRQGRLTLKDHLPVPQSSILPDTQVFDRGQSEYTLEELLYWMVTLSDNTATNVILDTLGLDAVNEYCAVNLGLSGTVCQRKMLDFAAAGAGKDNLTTAADQRKLFCLLHSRAILNPDLRRVALSILSRQRHQDTLLRYIPDEVVFAHKTGGLDGVAHDCELFLSLKRPLFVGVFTWNGPSPDGDPGQRKFIGRLGKAIFDYYKEM